MVWSPMDERWKEGFSHAKHYLESLNGRAWKKSYTSPDGFKTGEWIRGQLRILERGTMKPERQVLFQSLGLTQIATVREESKVRIIPTGGKRNDLQIESRS